MIGRSERRLWIGVELALRLTLALAVLIGAVSGAVLAMPWAAAGPTGRAAAAAYTYDTAANALESTNGEAIGDPAAGAERPPGSAVSGILVGLAEAIWAGGERGTGIAVIGFGQ